MTAGNDEEWCVRKLINVGKGVKHLPLGCRAEKPSESMKLCSAFFDQPANLRRLAAYESVMRCLSPSSNSPFLFQASQSWMTRLWYDSAGWHLGNCRELPPLPKNKREETRGGQCFEGDDSSVIDAIYLPSNLTLLLPSPPASQSALIPQVSSHILWNGVLFVVRWRRISIPDWFLWHVRLVSYANLSLLYTHIHLCYRHCELWPWKNVLVYHNLWC